ncbi:MAG: AarF/ABC1/UbiB kinase family protein [Deltaproteobacteria bacterium]|nr:AarF/ABC1/UbiB kinase family protein [Deltaproteobacteria bacterium]
MNTAENAVIRSAEPPTIATNAPPTSPSAVDIVRERLRSVWARPSTLRATVRLARAMMWFGLILGSYRLQRGLERLFGEARLRARRERVHARNARRFYRACLKMRGVYIKLGQVLSVMGSFLPPVYLKELEGLQDRVPARRFPAVARSIERALGMHPDIVFAEFDRAPVAAASLGQVHRAVTHDGREVAVKVLYDDVDSVMKVDLKVIGWALRVVRRMMPVGQLGRLHQQLTEMLSQETDLRHEARCLVRMGTCFAQDASVVVPGLVAELSSREVLTMTFERGVKVSDAAELARLGIAPQAVARKLVEVMFHQLLVAGFFHADPHPGNFFVRKDAAGGLQLVLLDLGSAQETRPELVGGLMQILAGLMGRDDGKVLTGIETMGFIAEGGDRGLLETTVRRYFERLLDVDPMAFAAMDHESANALLDPGLKGRELKRLMQSIEYPEGWFYVERAAVMLFGMSSTLAPSLNLLQVGFPFVARYLAASHRAG